MNPRYLIALGLSLTLCGGLSASAAELNADKSPEHEPACRDTGSYVPPQIPWMGEFIYKVALKVRDGRPEGVDIDTVRGPDKISDRSVTESLKEHVKKNYVCDGNAPEQVFYLRLNFKHELPALVKKRAASESALHAAAAASASQALAADMPAKTLVPVRAGMVCTAMGKPELPRVNAVGTLTLHVIAEVSNGKVDLVDTKLKMGSSDPALNSKFIDIVNRTIRETYQCPGNHVFEQVFTFKLT